MILVLVNNPDYILLPPCTEDKLFEWNAWINSIFSVGLPFSGQVINHCLKKKYCVQPLLLIVFYFLKYLSN